MSTPRPSSPPPPTPRPTPRPMLLSDARGPLQQLREELHEKLRRSAEEHRERQEHLIEDFLKRALGPSPPPAAACAEAKHASVDEPETPRPEASDDPEEPDPGRGAGQGPSGKKIPRGHGRGAGQSPSGKARQVSDASPIKRSSASAPKLRLSGHILEEDDIEEQYRRKVRTDIALALPKWLRRRVGDGTMERIWELFRYREHPNAKDGKMQGRLISIHGKMKSRLNSICALMTLGYAVFTWFNTNAAWTACWERTESHAAWWAVDFAFLCFFTIEVGLKLLANGWYFFTNKDRAWNRFEFLLVLISLFEQLVLLIDSQGMANLMYLKVLQVLRVVKVLRVVRVFSYFKDMRLMIYMVAGSIVSLFWCTVMILSTMYLWSILIMQLLLLNLEAASDFDTTGDEAEDIRKRFSTVRRTCLTLFQATTGGMDWADVYEMLLPHGNVVSVLFLAYIVFFVVVVWNIVTSTFVRKEVAFSEPDHDALLYNLFVDRIECRKELTDMFRELDTNMDGVISLNELRHLASSESVDLRNNLEIRGIRINDVEQFCQLVASMSDPEEAADDDSPLISVKTLVNACLHIRGQASTLDIQSLSFEVQRLDEMMSKAFPAEDARAPDDAGAHVVAQHPAYARVRQEL